MKLIRVFMNVHTYNLIADWTRIMFRSLHTCKRNTQIKDIHIKEIQKILLYTACMAIQDHFIYIILCILAVDEVVTLTAFIVFFLVSYIFHFLPHW